jgi:DNA-binding IclR family transcriptional regulator
MREEICPLIRRDKVYWSHESVLPNVAVCAAPVFDAQGELFCVIGAAIYARARTREHDQTVWQAVKTAAGSVSAELGHVPSSADGGD